MTEIILKTLQETREQLRVAYEQLKELQGELINGEAAAVARLELQLEQLAVLKEEFIQQREALLTTLSDGRRLFADQYEALKRFAENNGRDVREFFADINIKNECIVECRFSGQVLTTLEGLEPLRTLKNLSIDYCTRLKSLRGVPTYALEWVDAKSCGLVGDLSELAGAAKLRHLNIADNKALRSLRGMPTQSIEALNARNCGLSGDLSELSGAMRLSAIDVSYNNLSSLEGVPVQTIEVIVAHNCRLTGDQAFLSNAPHLRCLDLEWNFDLSLQRGNFRNSVDIKTTRPYWDSML